jgi:outer membrane murein-binding lipoprotein Lpp
MKSIKFFAALIFVITVSVMFVGCGNNNPEAATNADVDALIERNASLWVQLKETENDLEKAYEDALTQKSELQTSHNSLNSQYQEALSQIQQLNNQIASLQQQIENAASTLQADISQECKNYLDNPTSYTDTKIQGLHDYVGSAVFLSVDEAKPALMWKQYKLHFQPTLNITSNNSILFVYLDNDGQKLGRLYIDDYQIKAVNIPADTIVWQYSSSSSSKLTAAQMISGAYAEFGYYKPFYYYEYSYYEYGSSYNSSYTAEITYNVSWLAAAMLSL